MIKTLALCGVLLFAIGPMTAETPVLQNGVYHAEFSDYDEHGWKEYVDVQVTDGTVTVLTFDGVNAEGELKSLDESYKSSMRSVTSTWPGKFYTDITNQYLENGKLSDVDTVAGATLSTDRFVVLMSALEENFRTGDIDPRIVDAG